MYNSLTTGDPQDKRFFGIYRGVVADTNDPLNQNRIRMLVPQVLGEAVTSWCYPILGVPENKKVPYGSFYDYTQQWSGTLSPTGSCKVANTPTAMRLGSTDATSTQYVYVDGPHNTQITFEKAGVYNFQWSGQFENNASPTATHDVSVWLRQAQKGVTSTSGNDIAGSTGLVSIPAVHGGTPGHAIVGWNYLINAKANDYVELWWTSSSTGVTLQTYATSASPVYPSTASVVATVELVGGFLPLPGDGCWVMFEGGDPNFPLWLGAF